LITRTDIVRFVKGQRLRWLGHIMIDGKSIRKL
jgi:hypothetical protein